MPFAQHFKSQVLFRKPRQGNNELSRFFSAGKFTEIWRRIPSPRATIRAAPSVAHSATIRADLMISKKSALSARLRADFF